MDLEEIMEIFKTKDLSFVKRIFEEQNIPQRSELLESQLLNNLNDTIPHNLK